jgi:hypothetical protein
MKSPGDLGSDRTPEETRREVTQNLKAAFREVPRRDGRVPAEAIADIFATAYDSITRSERIAVYDLLRDERFDARARAALARALGLSTTGTDGPAAP